MKRGEFLKILGVGVVALAALPTVVAQELEKNQDEEIQLSDLPEDIRKMIEQQLCDAIRNDIYRRILFGVI